MPEPDKTDADLQAETRRLIAVFPELASEIQQSHAEMREHGRLDAMSDSGKDFNGCANPGDDEAYKGGYALGLAEKAAGQKPSAP